MRAQLHLASVTLPGTDMVGMHTITENGTSNVENSPNCTSTKQSVVFSKSSKNNFESVNRDDTLNMHELTRYLIDIPECDLMYFAVCLLPHDQESANVIKHIRCSGGSKGDHVKKICEAFLKGRNASWAKVYEVLKKAGCDNLARIIEICFLPI